MISAPSKSPDPSLSPVEILRRLENILRIGTIAQVRLTPPARVRVQSGELLTNWLPWFTLCAGDAVTWRAPAVGEQCMVLAPGGDLVNAAVLPALYCDLFPQNSESATEQRTTFGNGDALVHDSADGSFLLECTGSITLRVGGTTLRLTPEGAAIDPDLVGGGHVCLVAHRHGEVRSGSDVSGVPV